MKAQKIIDSPLLKQIGELQARIKNLEKRLSLQKQIQDALTISEQNLSAILEKNPDGILIVNSEGVVLYVNPAAESLFNKKEEEFLGSLFGFPVSVENGDSTVVIMNGNDLREVELRVVKVQWQGKPAFQLSVHDITHRKQAEKKIQDLAKFPSENPNPVMRIDSEGIILYSNEAGKILMQDWGCRVGESVPDELLSKIPNTSNRRPDKVTEIEIEQNQRFYRFFVTPIVDEGYINLYGINITKRRNAEDKLAREKYLTDALLANIPDLVYFKDLNSRFIRINKALSDRFKLSDPHEALYKTDKEFFEAGYSQKTYLDEQEIIKTGNPIIEKQEFTTWLDKSTSWYSITKMPLRNNKGEISGTFGISRDITKQKQSQEELLKAKEKAEENEAKFRELFSRVGDAIFNYNPDSFEILEANEATSAIYAYSHDELIGMSCLKFSAEAENSRAVANSIKNREKIKVNLRHHRKKDGTDVFVELSTYNIEVNGKRIYYSVCHDLTDITKTATELIKAKEKAEESDRLKTSFLNNISHEIRTPMNAIVGFSRLLGTPDDEKRQQYIDLVIQSSDNLLAIIEDIVRIASIEAGQEEIQNTEVNIHSLCKLIYEQFSHKYSNHNVELSYTAPLSKDELMILTDEIKLTQILTNLIGNALKFTHEGYVDFGYKVKNSHLEFYVKDSGIGISSEMHDKIFKRFRQVESTGARTYGGSGLGLSISKAYSDLLGGKIWLSSELGKGSTFYVSLPQKIVEAGELPEIPSLNATVNFENLNTVLIAEDDDINFLLLEEMFSDMNIKIIRALNGIEAVEICKSTQLDMVLMDLKMPQMDGYEASKRIKEFKPELKIIAQTAYSSEDDIQKAYACGICEFISKPLNRELLLSKINEQFHK